MYKIKMIHHGKPTEGHLETNSLDEFINKLISWDYSHFEMEFNTNFNRHIIKAYKRVRIDDNDYTVFLVSII